MGHTYRGPKSGCKMVMLFGGYFYDGVSAGIWVIHTTSNNLLTHFLQEEMNEAVYHPAVPF